MILVTIGLMYGFDRLIQEMDEIAGRTEEKVVMQIGETSYEPKNADYFRFVSEEEIDRLYSNARVVVCHAGVGSILTALGHNKQVIVVPRRKKYGEHVDDHQLEIAREMEREGKIRVAWGVNELEKALRNTNAICSTFKNENTLAKRLKEYLVRRKSELK